jgi:pimeloyl-ACP methyl ester carboxylesterase
VYDVTGSGSTDVLLMHAGVTDRRSWRAVVADLSDRHRCITYDARQFGESSYDPVCRREIADFLATAAG